MVGVADLVGTGLNMLSYNAPNVTGVALSSNGTWDAVFPADTLGGPLIVSGSTAGGTLLTISGADFGPAPLPVAQAASGTNVTAGSAIDYTGGTAGVGATGYCVFMAWTYRGVTPVPLVSGEGVGKRRGCTSFLFVDFLFHSAKLMYSLYFSVSTFFIVSSPPPVQRHRGLHWGGRAAVGIHSILDPRDHRISSGRRGGHQGRYRERAGRPVPSHLPSRQRACARAAIPVRRADRAHSFPLIWRDAGRRAGDGNRG